MAVPALQYHRVTFPAFPGVEMPAAYDQDAQRLYFPVATVCAALELDARPQRARLRREFAEHVRELRLPTAGGPQDLLCVEYEALALWLATMQTSRVGERHRDRIRTFRAQVMAAASDILMGRLQPVPLDTRRNSGNSRGGGMASLLLQAEERIAALERVVFVGEPPAERETAGTGADDVRVTPCPYCGGLLHISVGTVEAVPAHPDGE